MATSTSTLPDSITPETRSPFWRSLERLPGVKYLKNLKISRKLTIAFGLLVALTLLVVAFSYTGSRRATATIVRTDTWRVPTALAASQAQANLLRMLGDMRSYLALGEPQFRTSYNQSRQAFEADLAELTRLSPNLGEENIGRLEELKAAFDQWVQFPDQLFELRNDQLAREPAYRLLATQGLRYGGLVLIDTERMIEIQADREPTNLTVALLTDLARFQGSFASMVSGLRGYVTTRNRDFRVEYRSSLAANRIAWERLTNQEAFMTPEQQEILARIDENRTAFLALPDEMFEVLQSDQYREDLYLFRTELVPLADTMQQLLNDITYDQQTRLRTELTAGRLGLNQTNQQILTGGLLALLVGVILAFIFRENISGPVRRLTGVADRIRTGDLEAEAEVESQDEIGILAGTFNKMTGQLRRTLSQVRQEKKRADDLLEVVIPIGVALSSEKDFNRLLENILLEAKSFCRADAGILFMRTEADRLKFVIVRNDSLQIAMGGTVEEDKTGSEEPASIPIYDDESGHGAERPSIAAQTAVSGTSMNIGNAYEEEILNSYGPGIFDEKSDYRSISYLTIPLKNSQDHVLGVLQLINAQDPDTGEIIPFDPNLQQMMESFSSLAVAALEAYIREQGLRQEIQQLRIEIDEVKRQKQVEEIVETDFFSDLQAKASSYRKRHRSQQRQTDSEDNETPDEDTE